MRPTARTSPPLVVLVVAAAAATATAEERFWTEPIEGRFGDAVNWAGGVPSTEDVAVFDLDAAPTVRFDADRTTDRIAVRAGVVTFEMDGGATYTLENPLAATPGITVGDDRTAELRFGPGTRLDARYAMVGLEASARGTLVVEGPDVALDVGAELRVAGQGVGGMTVAGGARVTSGAGAIGVGETSLGAMTVTGVGALWDCAGLLTVAGEGQGRLSVDRGAVVTCDRVILGRQFGAVAEVVVSDPDTAWNIAGAMDVGQAGVATLRIHHGAVVDVGSFATIGTFRDGFGAGGVGTVTVDGAGSTLSVDGDLSVGYFADGTLVLSRGGAVLVGGDLRRAVDDVGTTRMVIDLGAASDYPAPALRVQGSTEDFAPSVRLVDGYVPAAGDLFEIAAAGGGVGAFTFMLPPLDPGLAWRVIGETSRIALAVETLCGPADVNGDGVVDFGDVLAILSAWGTCEGCRADVDGSGVVDFGDVLLVLADWGACT